jgi:trigger factor
VPTTVENLGPARVKLTVEIPFAELQPYLDKAYKEIAQSVNIPGFRRGKVPPRVIDSRFGRGLVLQEAINEALPHAFGEAITESGVAPMGEPDIDITEIEDNDKVVFTAELDVRPEFEMPDFTAVKATVDPLGDLDAEVDERLEIMRQRFATRTDVDRAAADGDVVVIDLVATKDGEDLEDATASGITYKIGSGGMLDGLDEAVKGLSADESADFKSTLVGGPNEGEEADIHVTVTKVQEETLPEVDDEFAQMISQFDTVEEMRADLTEAVRQQAVMEQLASARDKILEQLVEAANIPLPEKTAEAEIEGRRGQINSQLAQAGLTLDRYLEETEIEDAKTADEFWANLEKNTNDAIRARILLDQVAEDEQIIVEQDELMQSIYTRAARSGTTPEQELQHMMDHNHANEWMDEIRRDKALQLILSKADVVDTDGNKVEVQAPAGSAPEADEG